MFEYVGKLMVCVMSSVIMSASVSAAVYPVIPAGENLTASQLVSPDSWRKAPAIRCFRRRFTRDFLTAGNLSARVMRQKNHLLVRVECDRRDGFLVPMPSSYVAWISDNGAEVFLHDGASTQQFVFNARSAICYYRDDVQLPVPEGVQVFGDRQPGKWTAVLRLPWNGGKLAGAGLNIRISQLGSFTLEAEMGTPAQAGEKVRMDPSGRIVMQAGKQMVLTGLADSPQMDAGQFAEADRKINAEYFDMLEHYSGNPTLEELSDYGRRCHWDLARLQGMDAELRRPGLSLAEKDRLFQNMRYELADFQGKLMPVVNHEPKLVRGALTADFSRPCGKIRHLNGTNLGPQLYSSNYLKQNESFKAMNFSYVRTHDAPLDNPGLRMVDTSMIFANSHADVRDPQNYYFAPTDDYLKNILDLGCGIVYRLGVSIEHTVRKYAAHAPEDYDKFAEICAGIVRHYNHGWANGYHWNIRYWEVWNEPNMGLAMWDRSLEEYNRLYVTVARRLKREFPEIKVGGWSSCGFWQDSLVDFLKTCVREKAPLDFLSWHRYDADAHAFVADPFQARAWLDAFGYQHTETHLNEWHYFPGPWADFKTPAGFRRQLKKLQGIDAAVFTAHVMTRWQDTPLDLAQYYATYLKSWAVTNLYGEFNKNFYGLQAYGEIARYPRRVSASTDAEDTSLLAGHDGNGNGAVLVSAFRRTPGTLALQLKGLKEVRNLQVRVLDDLNDLTPLEVRADKMLLKLPMHSSSALFLVTFQCGQIPAGAERK